MAKVLSVLNKEFVYRWDGEPGRYEILVDGKSVFTLPSSKKDGTLAISNSRVFTNLVFREGPNRTLIVYDAEERGK